MDVANRIKKQQKDFTYEEFVLQRNKVQESIMINKLINYD